MRFASVLGGVWLLVGAPPPDTTASANPPADRPEVEVIVVDVEGVDASAFARELALRLPARDIVGSAQRPPDRPFTYVFVSRSEDTVHITLVEPDGRAYDRELPDEPDDAVRVAASATANLVFAVEGGEVEPDRLDATIPDPPTETRAETPAEEPEPATITDPPPSPQRPPEVELGVAASGGLVLGIAPTTTAGVFGGGGATLELAVRHRSAALVAASLRVMHRSAEGLELDRLRVGLGAGYGMRWRTAELNVVGRLGVEPWWLRNDGGSVRPTFEGASTSRRPLLGGAVVVTGGYLGRARDRAIAWRFGPRVELAGSFVAHHGARTIRIDATTPGESARPALRLGGLELELGLDLAFWFGVPTPSRAR